MRALRRDHRSVAPGGRSTAAGQSLVEFALVIPIFVALLMGVIEFGFLYNNLLTVQNALTPPVDHQRVEFVEIFQSDSAGDAVPGAINRYVRGGTLDCPGTGTQPYTLVGSEGYPQVARHDALVEGLDVIGVRIGYQYRGMTPIAYGRTWDLADAATLRMEPKQ